MGNFFGNNAFWKFFRGNTFVEFIRGKSFGELSWGFVGIVLENFIPRIFPGFLLEILSGILLGITYKFFWEFSEILCTTYVCIIHVVSDYKKRSYKKR